MKDSEVIIQLREENERQKLSLLALKRKVLWLDGAFILAAILAFVGLGAGYWQGGRDARQSQCSACPVPPVPACPVCAPVSNVCKDAIMEIKGSLGNPATTLSCPHSDQRIEPTNYGWVTCRCAPNPIERKTQ
jgi:hypothetical protein